MIGVQQKCDRPKKKKYFTNHNFSAKKIVKLICYIYNTTRYFIILINVLFYIMLIEWLIKLYKYIVDNL
jgi:hypothetical protein